LLLDELNENQISQNNIKDEAISFKNVNVSWSKDKDDLVLTKYKIKFTFIIAFKQLI